jgi:hypothetical protein
MKKRNKIGQLICLFFALSAFLNTNAQNALVGTGFSSGWGGASCPTGNGNFKYFAPSVNGTYILSTNANSVGDNYFRFGVDWSGTTKHLAITPFSDIAISPNTTYNLNTNCTTNGSQVINSGSTAYNYIFKTLNAGPNPTGQFVFFEIQGAVNNIANVQQSLACADAPVTITATANGIFSQGQSAYLRYSTNNFATSTVVEMTLASGNDYTASIPAFAASTSVSYYVFTSGTANLATNGSNADLYTINLNNNLGANYTYNVAANVTPIFPAYPTPVICEEAVLSPLPTTSTNGVSGSWSPVLNNTTTTTYTFTPAAGQCADPVTTTITVNPASPITVSTTITHVACKNANNGAITISFNNAISPLQIISTNFSNTSLTATNLPADEYQVFATDAVNCSILESITVTEPASVVVVTTSVVIPVACAGNANGAVTAVGVDGTGPYTYSWYNGLTNTPFSTNPLYTGLVAGIYTVTIKDANNCTTLETIDVQDGLTFNAIIQINQNVSCFGGSDGALTAQGVGGASPYNFAWSNGINTATQTSLLPGTYSVTITDDNGCVSMDQVTIIQPAAPVAATLSASDLTCNGINTGSITATVTGGTSPYSFVWSSPSISTTATASDLPAGSYTVTITDNKGCTTTNVTSISEPTYINIVSSIVHPLCFGDLGSVSFVITGGTGALTFSPSNVTNLLPNTTYTYIATDAVGCTSIAQVSIDPEPSPVTINSIAKTDALCVPSGAMTITAGGGIGSYSFQLTSNLILETNPSGIFSSLAGTTYTVQVADASGCSATSITSLATINNLSIAGVVTHPTVCLVTNGAISFTTTGNNGIVDYTLNNSMVMQSPLGTYNTLSAGTYTIAGLDALGCTASTTFVLVNSLPIMLNTSSTNPTCANNINATITAVASGEAPFVYSLSPTATQLSPGLFSAMGNGSYTLTVTDAKNCTASSIININTAVLTVNTAGVINPKCNGNSNGIITLQGTGGTPVYNFTLTPTKTQPTSGTFININSGIYIARVVDANGCSKTKVVPVAQPAVISFTSVSKTNVSCNSGNNGTLSASTTGGTGLKVLSIMPMGAANGLAGFNNLTSAAYTLTATDANMCTRTSLINITQPTSIVWGSILVSQPTSGNNGQITLSATGGTGSKVFSINPMATQSPIGKFIALGSGSYQITATDANNCTITTQVTLATPNTMNELNAGSVTMEPSKLDRKIDFNLFPNPVTNRLSIELESNENDEVIYTIVDINGKIIDRKIAKVNTGINIISINVTDLSNGLYHLQLRGKLYQGNKVFLKK